MANQDILTKFEKCSNYSVLSLLIYNTLTSVKRFKDVPRDELLTKIYSTIKSKASRQKA